MLKIHRGFIYLKDTDSTTIKLEGQYGMEEALEKDLADQLKFDIKASKNMLTEVNL